MDRNPSVTVGLKLPSVWAVSELMVGPGAHLCSRSWCGARGKWRISRHRSGRVSRRGCQALWLIASCSFNSASLVTTISLGVTAKTRGCHETCETELRDMLIRHVSRTKKSVTKVKGDLDRDCDVGPIAAGCSGQKSVLLVTTYRIQWISSQG